MGRKKKEIKLKEPVRIREKKLLDGSISLFLDIYYRGNRKKEGLKLYLVPEISAATKLQNANTLPIFIIADTFNRVVFVSQGYTIGLGDQLMKVIHKL